MVTAIEQYEPQGQIVKLSDLAIQQTTEVIHQAEKLVMEVLEPGIDFGIHPGTSSMALKDCGASKIANAFNTYPEHTILHYVEKEGDLISCLIQTKLILRNTGQVVASGVGSCSTMETKYAYRWVENPEDYGFDKSGLKYDKKKGKYRVPNPDIEDVGNTIVKMASKRSETDATQSLPGVGSALKKLFERKEQTTRDIKQNKSPKREGEGPRWNTFWGEVQALGLTEQKVYEILQVKSITEDWLKDGKTLNDATVALAKAVGLAPGEPGKPQPPIQERDPASITDVNALFRACMNDFGMQPAVVCKELGYPNALALNESGAKMSDCYITIKSIYLPK
jgi:hypothetical protein